MMANKHWTRGTQLLVSRDIQHKTTRHCIPAEWLPRQALRRMERCWALLLGWWKWRQVQSLWEAIWQPLVQLSNTAYGLRVSAILSREKKHTSAKKSITSTFICICPKLETTQNGQFFQVSKMRYSLTKSLAHK
jgi:hypothetical protein